MELPPLSKYGNGIKVNYMITKRDEKHNIVIEDYEVLEDVVRNSFAGVVWSHKIQEKQSDILTEKFKKLQTVNIVSASLTSAGIVALIFTDPMWLKVISTIVSFVSIYASTYIKTFDMQKLINAHKATANKLIVIRDKYKVLLAEIKLQKDSVSNLLSKYEELVKETNDIYLEAPSTTDKAVERAGEALKIKKDNTFSDEDIDSYLPLSLRKQTNEE